MIPYRVKYMPLIRDIIQKYLRIYTQKISFTYTTYMFKNQGVLVGIVHIYYGLKQDGIQQNSECGMFVGDVRLADFGVVRAEWGVRKEIFYLDES